MTEGNQPPFPTSGEPEKPQAPDAGGPPGAEQPAEPGAPPPRGVTPPPGTPPPAGATPPAGTASTPGAMPPPYPPAPRWGAPPMPAQPYAAQQQAAQQHAAQQQAAQQQPGAQQYAAQQQQYAYAPPQPGYPPHYGGPYYQQAPYGYAPGYYPYYSGPDNGLAVASLTLAIIAIVILFLFVGFTAPISIVASIIAVILGLKGKKAVDEGRTRKNRDVAVAGFWTGIAGIVLAVLAIVAWTLIIIFANDSAPAGPGDLSSLARAIIDALSALTA